MIDDVSFYCAVTWAKIGPMTRWRAHSIMTLALSIAACGGDDESGPVGPSATGGSGGSGGSGGAATGGGGSGATVVDPGDPPPAGWAMFGGDLAHTRSNLNETAITTANVSTLRLAWDALAPGVTATPAIVDGIVYWSDWQGGVHANDLADGSVVWDKAFPVGFTSSPFVTEDHVFLSDRGAGLLALHRSSGEVAWQRTIDAWPRTHLWSSPAVVDGVIVIGIASDGTQRDRNGIPQEEAVQFRGSVVGLDESTGTELWRFETTNPSSNGAGVSVWSSAAIDRQRKVAYIGTGNGYERPVSEFSNALLAIDYETGVRGWHQQFTPDDAFTTLLAHQGPDSDIGAAPNLFTIDDGGTPRDVVGVGDKAGFYRVHDRDSGAFVWETLLEPVLFDTKVGGVIAPAAYFEGRIFVVSNLGYGSSMMWALDAATGGKLWQSEPWIGVTYCAPSVANGVVFSGSSAIDPFATAIAPTGSTGVGDPSEMIALDAANGAVLHRTMLSAGRGGGYAIADGYVAVGTGFTFYGYGLDEPLFGGLQVFTVN